MIDKLNINNFLTFDSLEIKSLKRINLIGGKNNAGKTSFLEALLLLISKGENRVINSILENRGIWEPGAQDTYKGLIHNNIKSGPTAASINDLILIKLNKPPYFSLSYQGDQLTLHPSNPATLNQEYFSYVSSKTSLAEIAKLWDKIVLTDIEDDVLQMVQSVIDDRITRIHISNQAVLSKIDEKPVNLKTLGEGVSRILFIALHLAMAKEKYLLIDEIETGLHYTAQEELWEFIFRYAEKWNIQVFATTHSNDTIRSFKYACAKYEINGDVDAQYIRLQKSRSGKFEAICYDRKRLYESIDLNLEIR